MTSVSALPATATADDLADALSISARRVRQLATEGIIPRTARGTYALKQSVRRYVQHRRQEIAQRARRSSDDVLHERARKLQLTNDANESDLLPCADVLAALTAITATLKAELEQFPDRFPDHRDRLAAELRFTIDGIETRHRRARAALLGGDDALADAGG